VKTKKKKIERRKKREKRVPRHFTLIGGVYFCSIKEANFTGALIRKIVENA
jgi:hypothetical protein